MLSAHTLDTVKGTAPILAQEGEAITRLFYRKLFNAHPELKNVFNMAHQAQGDQPRALADSVFNYAKHIDRLDELGPLVKRIAHKHASLAVAPDQYPIVGQYLLEAVGEHLGLAPDHEVITAWAEAYQQLAEVLIGAEEQIYADNAAKTGGWRGFRAFVIRRIVQEAEGVKSFYLQPQDGGSLAPFEAGQYIGIKVDGLVSEYEEIRQYSLSDSPSKDHYRITVKSEAMNAAHPGTVSNALHASQEGDLVWAQPPVGDFVIEQTDKDLVFIAAGVGITPLLSMLLSQLQVPDRASQITFIQCCRDQHHHLFADTLQALQGLHGFDYKVAYEQGGQADHQGRLTSEVLGSWMSQSDADVYFCGPKPFMGAVHDMLRSLGFAEERLHYELFGPHAPLEQ